MRKFKNVFLFLFFGVLFAPYWVNAESQCIKVDSIAKWEVLDHNKTVIHDSQGNSIAFVVFWTTASILQTSGETFRFFSPTICESDRVQTSTGMQKIRAIEIIRK